MKISAGDYVARTALWVGDEDQRIVYRRVGFGLKYRSAVCESVADSTMHLRNAAQRISVLHSPALAMRLANLAAFEHAAQVCGGFHLSGMRAHLVNAHIERRIGSSQGVARESSQHISGIHESLCCEQCQGADRQHGLCAIDERDRLFGFKDKRLDLGPLQSLRSREASSCLVVAFAFTNQSECQMCKWG